MGTEAAQPERQWDGIVRRSFGVTTRGVDVATRSVEVVASTTTIDSHGDIVEQDWILDRYLKNPVVLWHHNNFESSGWSFGGACDPEDFLPIGHSKNTRVEGGQLVALLKFGSKEYNEMSERVFLGFVEEHIRAVSVGFYPGKVTEELTPGGGTIYRLSSNELLEISAVPIPSNPDAVAKAIAWERQHLGRIAAGKAAISGKEAPMAMTPEEKAAFDAALSESKTIRERVATLESELRTEKTEGAKLIVDLKSASDRAKAAEDALIEQKLKELVGVKITTAELPEEIETAKALGIERVLKRLSLRPDMKMLAPATAGGSTVKHDNGAHPIDASEANGDAGYGSDEIVKSASESAHRAA